MSGAMRALTLMPSWYAKGKNLKNLLLFARLCICLVDSVSLVLLHFTVCTCTCPVRKTGYFFFFIGSRFAAFQVSQSNSHRILRIRIKPISSFYF